MSQSISASPKKGSEFQLDRLLRRKNIERLCFGLKVILLIVCLLLLILSAKRVIFDVLHVGSDVTELRNKVRTTNIDDEGSTLVESEKVDPSEIIKHAVFGEIGKVAVKPQATAKPKPISKLELSLIGTYITRGEPPYAIIENKKRRDQDVFNINDSIFGEADLKAIYSDRVEISRNGQTEILKLDDSADSGSGPATDSSEGDSVVVDQTELDKALDNLPLLLTQARAVPYFKDGKSIGLRLFAIKRGSLYEKIGLKNGDILKAINDNSLADITQAVKLFEKLREERSISVTLERNRQEKRFKYSIQ